MTYVLYDRKDSSRVKGFLFKILDIDTDVYYVEFPVGAVSIFVPLKYYKYPRADRRAGGDSGQFHVPQFVAVGLHEWGIQPGYVYVKIWRMGWAQRLKTRYN